MAKFIAEIRFYQADNTYERKEIGLLGIGYAKEAATVAVSAALGEIKRREWNNAGIIGIQINVRKGS